MKALTSDGDQAAFFDALSNAPARILFLDFDGTLAPFREKRHEAAPYPGVAPMLDRIASETRTRLVFVSGRSISDIQPLLGLRETPEIWGSHGREHLDSSGRHAVMEFPEDVASALSAAREWARGMGLAGHFEEKAGCAALHWRAFPGDKAADIREKALAAFSALSSRSHTRLHEFDGGLEIQAPGRDKGWAIRQVLDGRPDGLQCAFLGDDQTDEDGFRALRGRGLSVLVRRELRETEADLWIRPPEELLEFLDRWREACTSRRSIS